MRTEFRSVWLAACVGIALIAASGRAVLAQHGGMHESAPMQDATMGAGQMMKKVDAKLTAAAATMREVTAQHAAMGANSAHEQMVSSLQGMLAQMQQLQGTLAEMMRDPTHMEHRDSMKAIEQTCRDFEQMAGAFQSMAKSIGKIMKETNVRS